MNPTENIGLNTVREFARCCSATPENLLQSGDALTRIELCLDQIKKGINDRDFKE
jgi:hypothetical protein